MYKEAYLEGIKCAKELTARGRKQISKSNFVFPKERRYPIHDKIHARNALARVAQHGSASEKAKVRAAVHSRYPGIGKESSLKGLITSPYTLDIAGLGLLGAPSAHDLLSKDPMSTTNKSILELSGLGLLAGGSLKNLLKSYKGK